MSSSDQDFVPQDSTSESIPQGTDTTENSYASRPGQTEIPVVGDNAAIEVGAEEGDADSDARLQQDEADAISEENILDGDRTRHAKPEAGTYREPGDEEGLPGPEDGTSSN